MEPLTDDAVNLVQEKLRQSADQVAFLRTENARLQSSEDMLLEQLSTMSDTTNQEPDTSMADQLAQAQADRDRMRAEMERILSNTDSDRVAQLEAQLLEAQRFAEEEYGRAEKASEDMQQLEQQLLSFSSATGGTDVSPRSSSEMEDLKAALEASNAVKGALQAQCKQQLQQLTSATTETETLRQQVRQLEQTNAALEGKSCSLEDQLQSARGRLENQIAELASGQAVIAEGQVAGQLNGDGHEDSSHHVQLMAAKDAQLKAQQQNEERLKGDLEAAEKQVAQLQLSLSAQLEAHEAALAAVTAQHSQSRADEALLKKQIVDEGAMHAASEQDAQAELKQQLELASKKLQDQEAELSTYKAKMQQLAARTKDRMAEQEAAAQVSAAQLEESNQTKAQLEVSLATAAEQAAEASSELEAVQACSKRYKDNAAAVAAELAETSSKHTAAVQQLEECKAALEAACADKKDAVSGIEQNLETANTMIAELRQQGAETQQQLQTAAESASVLEQQLEEQKTAVHDAQAEAAQFAKQLCQRDDNTVENEQQLQQLTKQVQKKTDLLDQSDNRREKLLAQAVASEREAWEQTVSQLNARHAEESAMMASMLDRVPAPVEVPVETESSVQQGIRAGELEQRLTQTEDMLGQQSGLLQAKELQLKELMQQLMEAQQPTPDASPTQQPAPVVAAVGADELDKMAELLEQQQQEVELLRAEKAEVMQRAKQAVGDLTAQLHKTRSSREQSIAHELLKAKETLCNLTQQAAIDANVKAFLAKRNAELEQPEGLDNELDNLRAQVTGLSEDIQAARRREHDAQANCRRAEEKLRQLQIDKEDTLNQIQEFGVNSFVSNQLQELRDALQSVHAERDDAVEQLNSANSTKHQLASRLMELGQDAQTSPTPIEIPFSPAR